MQVHGSCAARGDWAVLLLGPSGSGKSDLLLRLLEGGWDLIADDRVDIEEQAGRLHVSAPARLHGLLEVRGLGIVRRTARSGVPLALAVRLAPADTIARLPEPALWRPAAEALGREPAAEAPGVPLMALDPACASAPARLALALDLRLGLCTAVASVFGDQAPASIAPASIAPASVAPASGQGER